MSLFLKILALLSQLQNVKLVQEIEQCVLTNGTMSGVWQCILSKLQAANLATDSPDHAVAEEAAGRVREALAGDPS